MLTAKMSFSRWIYKAKIAHRKNEASYDTSKNIEAELETLQVCELVFKVSSTNNG